MKSTLSIDPEHVLNIYITSISGNVRGWGVMPDNIYAKQTPYLLGAIIEPETLPGGSDPNLNLGINAVHEVGHCFGLYHTFVDRCNLGDLDLVSDTPVHLANYGCPNPIPRTCEQEFDVFDPIHNFMNYTNDVCRWEFTTGQIVRMNQIIQEHLPNLGGDVIKFTSNKTVASGDTYEFFKGEFKFANDIKLIVNGFLEIKGTPSNIITLTKSGSSNWGGIQFNSGSSGTLDFCNITYATTGINMYNSSPTIKHSTIDNNSGVGVYCDYYSSPVLVGNNIRNNSSYGLRGNSYSSPNLTDNGYPGSNVIRNNQSWGINVTYNCNPNLNGYLTYGNSIFDNATCNVAASDQCTVNAQRVWWGQNPPNYYMFCEGGSSTIDWSNPLTSNPNPGRRTEPTEMIDKEPIHVTMSVQFDELELAEQKQREGKHDEAINLFLEVFKKEPSTSRGRYALIKIEECFTQAKKKDFIDFSKKELRPLFKEEKELFVVLLELETHQLYNLSFDDQAVNNLKMILNKYNLNEAIEKQTLYRIGAFYLDLYNDKLSAQKTFDDLASKYPEDELLAYANLMLNEDRYNTQRAKNIDQQIIAVEETKEVLDNYPNPFNPTTTITFTLLAKENIKLKIFDVLGNEVAILADSEFEIGKHDIPFDASKLPSGVYFYNLTTKVSSITKKMLLLK